MTKQWKNNFFLCSLFSLLSLCSKPNSLMKNLSELLLSSWLELEAVAEETRKRRREARRRIVVVKVEREKKGGDGGGGRDWGGGMAGFPTSCWLITSCWAGSPGSCVQLWHILGLAPVILPSQGRAHSAIVGPGNKGNSICQLCYCIRDDPQRESWKNESVSFRTADFKHKEKHFIYTVTMKIVTLFTAFWSDQ